MILSIPQNCPYTLTVQKKRNRKKRIKRKTEKSYKINQFKIIFHHIYYIPIPFLLLVPTNLRQYPIFSTFYYYYTYDISDLSSYNQVQIAMSAASSDTGVYNVTPKVVCVFLAQFDTKLGYKLVWTSLPNHHELAGIEYRALPSGIHEYSSTTLYLTHELQGVLHYGMARFRQVDFNPENTINAANLDRLLVKMYSLGVLVEPLKGLFWPPLQYLSLGWEYTNAVDATLVEFLNNEDLSLLIRLNELLSHDSLAVPKAAPSYDKHPLSRLPAALSLVGPLLFPLYKAAILRKRILIFGSSSQANATLLSDCQTNRDPGTAGALAYLLSLLSIIPKDVPLEDPETPRSSQPIYTIGLNDLESHFFTKFPGYIATTGDEILKMQTNVYDISLLIPASDCLSCLMSSSSEPKTPIKSTYNDYSKFLKLYQKLPQEGSSVAMADDLASIKTSTSLFSALGLAFSSSDKFKLQWEPQWWLTDATSPMSWREYVWLAFAWFASAGATDREAETIDLADAQAEDDARSLLVRLTNIVAQFHRLTKKWFYIIDEIVSEMVEYVQSDIHGQLVLELTIQDVVDMELDPYSLQDLEFIREFVLTYWGHMVSDVDIGLGIHGVCC